MCSVQRLSMAHVAQPPGAPVSVRSTAMVGAASRRVSSPVESATPQRPTDITDAVLTASRALVAVAARSLAKVDDSVTLPQFRALVVLSQHDGECSVGHLAEALDVHSSTTTRLCDRLVARRLVRRSVRPTNRRETMIVLTDRGRAVVDEVTAARRREIEGIVERIPEHARTEVVAALQAFSDAAGEPGVTNPLGWP